MTLFVDLDLPPGALLEAAKVPLGPGLEAMGAIWFDFHPDSAIREAGRVTGLRSRTGGAAAMAVEANEGHAVLIDTGAAHALVTEARRNAGFALAPRPLDRLSVVAVLMGAGGGRATIAALEASDSGRDFHLSLEDGGIVLTERRGAARLHLPLPPRASPPVLVEATIAPDALTLALDGGAPRRVPLDPPRLPEAARMLIACRRTRPGLWNTLGDLRIGDLIFLPGTEIFAPDAADLRAALRVHAGLGA